MKITQQNFFKQKDTIKHSELMVALINHVQGVHVARTNILPLRSLKFEFLSIRMIKAEGTIIVA